MNVLLCPLADPGYRYSSIAVGLELRRRGHAVRILEPAPGLPPITPPDLDPCLVHDLVDPRTFRVGRWFLHGLPQFQAVVRAARETRAEVLVTSLLCHGALLAAEFLDLPVVVLGLAAHLWPYQAQLPGEPAGPELQREWRLGETGKAYQQAREAAELPPRDDRAPQAVLSGSALLLRGDPAFEEPGAVLPDGIRHVGPCWWEPAAPPSELGEIDERIRRVGKPVVYVHLGRSFGGTSLWPWLNETFRDGPFQAVVELGRSGAAQPDQGTDILVVRKPWMSPLVDRADVVLTNATTSPVLAALLGGRPLLVAPAGGEQLVLGEACVRAGLALRLPTAGGSGSGADGAESQHAGAVSGRGGGSELIAAVLADRSIADRVRQVGERLRQSKSEAVAADAVEAAC